MNREWLASCQNACFLSELKPEAEGRFQNGRDSTIPLGVLFDYSERSIVGPGETTENAKTASRGVDFNLQNNTN